MSDVMPEGPPEPVKFEDIRAPFEEKKRGGWLKAAIVAVVVISALVYVGGILFGGDVPAPAPKPSVVPSGAPSEAPTVENTTHPMSEKAMKRIANGELKGIVAARDVNSFNALRLRLFSITGCEYSVFSGLNTEGDFKDPDVRKDALKVAEEKEDQLVFFAVKGDFYAFIQSCS